MKQKLHELFQDMWNVPNALTLLRLALVPVMAVLYFQNMRMAALAVFVLASLTDWADGYIARKYQLITNFGKLMDPLADKLMVLCALICHGIAGVFPWTAIGIVAAKELLMVAGGALMLKRGIVVYSNLWGKSATVVFIAALILGYFHSQLPTVLGCSLDVWVLWAAVALTLCALGVYAYGAARQLQAQEQQH